MAEMTVKPQVKMIQIDVSGPVGTGKSAIAASIKKMLESHGYCVAIPQREERNNPSKDLENAAHHEKPKPDSTVIVVTEDCVK